SVGTVAVPAGVEPPAVGVDDGTGVLVAGVVLAFGVTLGGASAEAERGTPGQNGICGLPSVYPPDRCPRPWSGTNVPGMLELWSSAASCALFVLLVPEFACTMTYASSAITA